jgi:hypothetical protein
LNRATPPNSPPRELPATPRSAQRSAERDQRGLESPERRRMPPPPLGQPAPGRPHEDDRFGPVLGAAALREQYLQLQGQAPPPVPPPRPLRQQPPAEHPDWLYCSKGRHFRPPTEFEGGRYRTCARCRQASRDYRGAQQAGQALQARQAAEQLARIELDREGPAPRPDQEPAPRGQLPDNPDLNDTALPEHHRQYLKNFRDKVMALQLDCCTGCREEWLELGVQNGLCTQCRKGQKFQAVNNMDPGLGPPAALPKLTSMEEIMISPVHAFLQVWQVRGGQFKYTGHVCNFARDTERFVTRLPLLPEECDIIILRRAATGQQADELPYEDFRVRRRIVQQWLQALCQHHPTFRTRRVTVDPDIIARLPENGLVHGRVRSIATEDVELAESFEGPPQDGAHEVCAPQFVL